MPGLLIGLAQVLAEHTEGGKMQAAKERPECSRTL
jgi:hypothetical protein